MRKTTAASTIAISAALLMATSIGASAQGEAGGFTFEPLTPVSAESEIEVVGIAELADGQLGVIGGGYPSSSNGYTMMSWGSSDGGQTWAETRMDVPPNAGSLQMAVHADRFVAVGSRHHEDPSHTSWVWASTDAVDWELVSQIENAYVSAIQTTPDGLAMLGMDFREADGFGERLGGYPTIWFSEDGILWEAHEISAPLYTADWEQPQFLQKLARSDDGTWMASGRKALGPWSTEDGPPPFGATAWISDADMAWREVELPAEVGFGSLEQWTSAGFVFSTTNAGPGNEPSELQTGLWLTGDGSDWTLTGDTGQMAVERSASDGTGMVGWPPAFKDPFTEPTILDGSPMYVSPDGQTWEHPTPHMLEGVQVSSASFTPDGRLLIAGKYIAGCEEFVFDCIFGFAGPPGLWVGTPN